MGALHTHTVIRRTAADRCLAAVSQASPKLRSSTCTDRSQRSRAGPLAALARPQSRHSLCHVSTPRQCSQRSQSMPAWGETDQQRSAEQCTRTARVRHDSYSRDATTPNGWQRQPMPMHAEDEWRRAAADQQFIAATHP